MEKLLRKIVGFTLLLAFILVMQVEASAQAVSWIRPDSVTDKAVWGLRNGIIFGFWPNPIEPGTKGNDGGLGVLYVLGMNTWVQYII